MESLTIGSLEAEIIRTALKKLKPEMEKELAERKSGGNNSLSGYEELKRVEVLTKRLNDYLNKHPSPANPLSSFPNTLSKLE
jgi:hypothetical protein